MSRPAGITLLAVLAFFIGLWHLIKGLALLGVGGVVGVLAGTAHPVAGFVVLGLAAAFGVVALVIGAFYLGFAFGALGLKPWAWNLGYWSAAMAFGWTVLVVLGPATLRGRLWELVVNGGILYYLTRPDVKQAFGK
jgi:hypothetical protein